MDTHKLYRIISVGHLLLGACLWLFDKTSQATYMILVAIYFQLSAMDKYQTKE
jgi:hypothetical protein